MKKNMIFLISSLAFLSACTGGLKKANNTWEEVFPDQLSLLGHRNWVLIVDKAFPAQSAPGIEVIYTRQELTDVTRAVLNEINKSSHVRPVIYTDKELEFISSGQNSEVEDFKKAMKEELRDYDVQTLLHDSVFVKIDEASRLFKVLVLKTEGTIPYSSVFINLDCKYWNRESELDLRKRMNPDTLK